jgi:hypothetical protein
MRIAGDRFVYMLDECTKTSVAVVAGEHDPVSMNR